MVDHFVGFGCIYELSDGNQGGTCLRRLILSLVSDAQRPALSGLKYFLKEYVVFQMDMVHQVLVKFLEAFEGKE